MQTRNVHIHLYGTAIAAAAAAASVLRPMWKCCKRICRIRTYWKLKEWIDEKCLTRLPVCTQCFTLHTQSAPHRRQHRMMTTTTTRMNGMRSKSIKRYNNNHKSSGVCGGRALAHTHRRRKIMINAFENQLWNEKPMETKSAFMPCHALKRVRHGTHRRMAYIYTRARTHMYGRTVSKHPSIALMAECGTSNETKERLDATQQWNSDGPVMRQRLTTHAHTGARSSLPNLIHQAIWMHLFHATVGRSFRSACVSVTQTHTHTHVNAAVGRRDCDTVASLVNHLFSCFFSLSLSRSLSLVSLCCFPFVVRVRGAFDARATEMASIWLRPRQRYTQQRPSSFVFAFLVRNEP